MLKGLTGIVILCLGFSIEMDLRAQAPLQMPTLMQELQSSLKTDEAYEQLVK
jgi:hypothetical protein